MRVFYSSVSFARLLLLISGVWLDPAAAAPVMPVSETIVLKAPNADESDQFGSTVLLVGDFLFVGASREDGDGSSLDDNSLEDAGAVYVYTRESGSWKFDAYLKASEPESGAYFGSSLAFDAGTLVVGAPYEDVRPSEAGSVAIAGSAYVFTRQGTQWNSPVRLKPTPGPESNLGGGAGAGVAILGDSLTIGCPAQDGGRVFIYQRSGNVWQQQAEFNKPFLFESGDFGQTVDLHGELLVVGRPFRLQERARTCSGSYPVWKAIVWLTGPGSFPTGLDDHQTSRSLEVTWLCQDGCC